MLKKTKKIWVFLFLFFMLTNGLLYAKEEGGLVPVICVYKPVPLKSIKIESSLTLDYLWNRPDAEWEITDDGISKGYTYHRGEKTSHDWDFSAGQIFNLDVGFHPWKRLIGGFGIEAIGQYADTYWLPINDEHRMDIDNKSVKFVRGELKYLEGSWLMMRYFKGIGHYHWNYEGDMFSLYPESYIPNTYRRISGETTPDGGEIVLAGKNNKLTVVSGPRLVWGLGEAALGKYNFNIGSFESALIFKTEKLTWGREGEDLNIGEISTKTNILGQFPFQIGLMFKPFRVGEEYSYIKEVVSGTGYAGTSYKINKSKTDSLDAWAVKMKLSTKKSAPYIDESYITYTHAGLLAGNKNEVTVQMDKKLSPVFYTTGMFTYRKPLVGPMPFLVEGTADNPGPVFSTPRGEDDPFVVGQDNREASIFSLFLTYDPTPSSWFYQWEPNILQEWNLNEKENSKLAFGLGYTLSYFPTNTDLQTYLDGSGNTVWEPSGTHGLWATKRALSFITVASKINLPRDYRFLITVRAGEEISNSTFSYTLNQDSVKPITGLLSTTITMKKKPYTASVTYEQGPWGPEDWHRIFGQTFDRLYKVSLDRLFGSFNIGVEYLGTRETDGKYIPSMIGAFDEVRMYVTWRFSAFFSPPSGTDVPIIDKIPPTVSMKVLKNSFSPNDDGKEDTIDFLLSASDDESGIKQWWLEIFNQENNRVRLFSGTEKVPSAIQWDGVSDYSDKIVPEGIYDCIFRVEDNGGNISDSPSIQLKVEKPETGLPKEVKITREPEGLKVSITTKILFSTNRAVLINSAYTVLDKVADILKAYPKNKLHVTGHADSVGKESYNQKLSELRAQSVANYLINKSGVESERIKVIGYGETKPIASNATIEGRAKNRRVEIIILKLK